MDTTTAASDLYPPYQPLEEEESDEEQEEELGRKYEGIIDDIFALFSRASNKLHMINEKEKSLKRIEARVETMIRKAPQQIDLNVGGKNFSTTKSNLTRFSDSFFTVLLGNEEESTGTYFIDRDPKYFDVIISYLRTGKFRMKQSWDDSDLDEIREDLVFYNLEIPAELEAERKKRKAGKGCHKTPPNTRQYRCIIAITTITLIAVLCGGHMTQRGFHRVTQHLEHIEEKIRHLHTQSFRTEKDIFQNMEVEFRSLQKLLDRIEQNVKQWNVNQTSLIQGFDKVANKCDEMKNPWKR